MGRVLRGETSFAAAQAVSVFESLHGEAFRRLSKMLDGDLGHRRVILLTGLGEIEESEHFCLV